MNQNVTIDIGNGIQFNIPFIKFFSWDTSVSSSLMVFYDQNENDKSSEDKILQVGMNFMELFENVEFDFDYKNISFYSNIISIIKGKNYWVPSGNIKFYLLIFISGIMIIFSCLLFIKGKIYLNDNLK